MSVCACSIVYAHLYITEYSKESTAAIFTEHFHLQPVGQLTEHLVPAVGMTIKISLL